MSARAFTALAMRVWGLLVLARAVRANPLDVFLLTLSRQGVMPADSARLPGLVAAFVTAGVLILLADYIVYFAGVPVSRDTDSDLPQLLTAGLAIVGIWAVVAGLRDGLVEAFALMGRFSRDIPANMASELRTRQGQAVAESVMWIVAGVVILRRDGVAGVLNRIAAAAKRLHDPPIKE